MTKWYPRSFGAGALVLLALVSLSATSLAQTTFELERYHPAESQRFDYLTVRAGSADLPRRYELGMFMTYAYESFSGQFENQDEVLNIIEDQLLLHLLGSYAPTDWLRLSVDLPFYLYQDSNNEALLGRDEDTLSGGGIGDIRIIPKVSFFNNRLDDGNGAALGLALPFVLPTGQDDALQGEDFRINPMLAFDWANSRGFGVAINAGALARFEQRALANLEISSFLDLGAAVRLPLGTPIVQLLMEVNGALPLGVDSIDTEESPAEALAALRFLPGDFVITVGGGAGITPGYGAPTARGLLGFAYSPRAPRGPRDSDGDGIYDDVDECPETPEDFDNFEDEDGCPELDNDEDGIPDTEDSCPNQPEDFDGFEDEDGCPDRDNDEDGIYDEDDECPDDAEVFNDFEDEDGCPDEAPPEEPEVTIDSVVYFPFDSASPTRDSRAALDEIAQTMQDNPELELVVLEGHADERGSTQYNRDLSVRRAEAVRRELTRRGIDESRIQVEGFGSSRPVVRNPRTEEEYSQNRRVEVRILSRR